MQVTGELNEVGCLSRVSFTPYYPHGCPNLDSMCRGLVGVVGRHRRDRAEGRLLACSPFWPPWRLSKTDLPSGVPCAGKSVHPSRIRTNLKVKCQERGRCRRPPGKEGTMDERWGLVVIVARGRACLTPKRDANKEIHADVF